MPAVASAEMTEPYAPADNPSAIGLIFLWDDCGPLAAPGTADLTFLSTSLGLDALGEEGVMIPGTCGADSTLTTSEVLGPIGNELDAVGLCATDRLGVGSPAGSGLTTSGFGAEFAAAWEL